MMNEQKITKFLAEAMGWTRFFEGEPGYEYNFVKETGEVIYFNPMNQIEHAWMVVEWMVKQGWYIDIQSPADEFKWIVEVQRDKQFFAEAETAPKAICIAAVRALGGEA